MLEQILDQILQKSKQRPSTCPYNEANSLGRQKGLWKSIEKTQHKWTSVILKSVAGWELNWRRQCCWAAAIPLQSWFSSEGCDQWAWWCWAEGCTDDLKACFQPSWFYGSMIHLQQALGVTLGCDNAAEVWDLIWCCRELLSNQTMSLQKTAFITHTLTYLGKIQKTHSSSHFKNLLSFCFLAEKWLLPMTFSVEESVLIQEVLEKWLRVVLMPFANMQ